MPIVDQFTQVDTFGPFGETDMAYFAQIFTAPASVLETVQFKVDWNSGPDNVEFRVLVTEANVIGSQFTPGAILFESAQFVEAFDGSDTTFTTVTVDVGSLALTPGRQYAFIFDAFTEFDGSLGRLLTGSQLRRRCDVGQQLF